MTRLLLFIVTINFLVGCADDSDVQRGDVVGKVGYYEKEFVNYIDSLEGVNVQLVNAAGVLETTSLPDGTFRFENVVAGNYQIRLKKDFFAYYEQGRFYDETPASQLTHIGGGTTSVGSFEFYEYPEYTTVIDAFEWASDSVLILHLTIPPSVQDYYTFNIYMSEDELVGPGDYDYIWQSGYSESYFEDAIVVDTTTGKVSLKLPFEKSQVNYYFAVSATSVWSYDLMGPESDPVLIRP